MDRCREMTAKLQQQEGPLRSRVFALAPRPGGARRDGPGGSAPEGGRRGAAPGANRGRRTVGAPTAAEDCAIGNRIPRSAGAAVDAGRYRGIAETTVHGKARDHKSMTQHV